MFLFHGLIDKYVNKNRKHNIMTIFLGKIFNKECFNDDAKENLFNFLLL